MQFTTNRGKPISHNKYKLYDSRVAWVANSAANDIPNVLG